MRIVKLDHKIPYFKTFPAKVLSLTLLDLRNLCNNIKNYKCKVLLSKKMYKYLIEIDKQYLFNTPNFDKQLYEQCRSNIKLNSMKASYLTCMFNNRLELEQYTVLHKFGIPIKFENETEYYKKQSKLENKKVLQKLLGENNDNPKQNFI